MLELGGRGGRSLVRLVGGVPAAPGGVSRACPRAGAGLGRGRSRRTVGRGTVEWLSPAAQSKADWGTFGRLQACSAEQKAEPAGEKGSGGGQPDN